jgi:hypothetical protein
VELWEAPIWDSARKHGISDEAMRHALQHRLTDWTDPDDDHFTLHLGADGAGNFIEVGVLDDGEHIVIIHAMRARWERFFPKE